MLVDMGVHKAFADLFLDINTSARRRIKLGSAYGRELEILKKGGSWRVFDLGNEGKKRPASDIAISPAVDANQFSEYMSDLLHEYASQRNPEVTSTE